MALITNLVSGAVDSPCFSPPASMSLFHYHSGTPSDSRHPILSDSLVVGSRPAAASNVVLESNNWDMGEAATPHGVQQAKGYAGQYLVGVYDPQDQTVSLHAAPVLTLSKMMHADASRAEDSSAGNYSRARRDLGEAFGNRKQKLAMRNADRMKVDTAGIDEKILSSITDSVAQSQQSHKAADASSSASPYASRPMPTPHLDAETPDQVYPMAELLPQDVSSSINISALLHANDSTHIKRLLPGPTSRSDYLAERIWSRVLATKRTHAENGGSSGILKTSSTHQRQQIKVLSFIALLWSIRALAAQSRGKALHDRKTLREKLRLVQRAPKDEEDNDQPAMPAVGEGEADFLLDHIFSRFTTSERSMSSSKARVSLTPFLETKMLTTILALCLHIDGFQLPGLDVLAAEMSIPAVKLKELTKSIGCTTRYRSADADTQVLDKQQAKASRGQAKVMVLKCPVVLPEGGAKGPPKRR